MNLNTICALENAGVAPVNGTAFRGYGTRYTMQTIGTFTATIQLQGSVNQVNWRVLDTLYGPDGSIAAGEFYPWLRVAQTSWTSGEMTCCYVIQEAPRTY
jgi:hypothetical protein